MCRVLTPSVPDLSPEISGSSVYYIWLAEGLLHLYIVNITYAGPVFNASKSSVSRDLSAGGVYKSYPTPEPNGSIVCDSSRPVRLYYTPCSPLLLLIITSRLS